MTTTKGKLSGKNGGDSTSDHAQGPNRGQRCRAEYHKQVIPHYIGNPLIEALPPIYTEKAVAKYLAFRSSLPEEIRRASKEVRSIGIVPGLRSLFEPLSLHLDLERRISQSIRTGYVSRNPTVLRSVRQAEERLQTFRPGLIDSPSLQSAPLGFSLVGMSGMGKTTSLTAILQGLYPQVILHTEYKGTPLLLKQIPWLILGCPSNGSLGDLCKKFFEEVDARVGTEYADKYNGATAEELGRAMARVASVQALGLLVMDEIQFLSAAKSGGKERILNFFVELVNRIGVPIVTVGTYKAMTVLGDHMLQIRRGEGCEGQLIWDNWLKDSGEFKVLIQMLFEHQYVKHPVTCSEELYDTLYDVSQGITDYLVKVFTAAQVRAMGTGKEQITPAIIRSVARDLLRQVEPILTALRTKNKDALLLLEDAAPIDIDAFITREARKWKKSSTESSEKGSTATDTPRQEDSVEGKVSNDVGSNKSERRAKRSKTSAAQKTTPSRKKGISRKLAA